SVKELWKKKISAAENKITADNWEVPKLTDDRKCIRLIGDYSFNIFNTDAALMYKSLGFDGVTLSAELNLRQICEISGNAGIDTECVVYGRLPLMTSEYCPVGSVKGRSSSYSECSGCCGKGEFRLKDRLGIEFPVICDKIDCRSTILNSNVLFVPDILGKLASAGISTLRLNIWGESRERIRDIVSLHRGLAGGDDKEKHAALVEQIKADGFTKGHFYKGV
ncbi:MAG: hypothetical protein FIA99_17375, partial [Ruminiclostridium sp.]|nr:hypothetical protein [Ruminiclostridium sp.]